MPGAALSLPGRGILWACPARTLALGLFSYEFFTVSPSFPLFLSSAPGSLPLYFNCDKVHMPFVILSIFRA